MNLYLYYNKVYSITHKPKVMQLPEGNRRDERQVLKEGDVLLEEDEGVSLRSYDDDYYD